MNFASIGAGAMPETSIAALLRPASIAIAGASADPGKIGSMPLAFLRAHHYSGSIYPINPNTPSIDGLECFKGMSDIGEDIDLLVIAIAAARIPELLAQCRAGQVKSAIILSSGFGETGADGRVLQDALRTQMLAKGIRFIGPNSVGLANLYDGVVPTISQVFDQHDLRPGPIALVTQSGAVGTAIAALAHAERMGIGYFVSTGNEGDLEFSDFCEYFAADPSVAVIAGYLERVRDGAKFVHAAKCAAEAGKPVILLKVGTTDVGRRAVTSHTGALAGTEDVYRCAFHEGGVVRVESLEEMVDCLKIFSTFPVDTRGAVATRARIGILSHSGGAGVLTADTCVRAGLDVPQPSEQLTHVLAEKLPAYASLQNPVDMTANVIFDPARMASVVYDMAISGEYDATILCVNLIWRQGASLSAEILRNAGGFGKRLAIAWIAGRREPIDTLNESGIPVFSDPVRCARAVGRKFDWETARRMLSHPATWIRRAEPMSTEQLVTHRGQETLFARYEIPLARGTLVQDVGSAHRAAAQLGYPVAAKVVAAGLVHKSEAAAVALEIAGPDELARRYAALDRIPIAEKEGILVQEMVRGQCELFAGTKRDEVFGPVVVFGLGGIYVEILRDTVLRLAPFSIEQAHELMRAALFYPMLAGARGRAVVNMDAIATLLSNISMLCAEQPGVKAIDLNPIIVSAERVSVVDAKVHV